MSLPNEVNLQHLGSTGYNLTKSLRLRASASAYLTRTPGSSGNRQKFTFSIWAKLGATALSGGDIFSSNNGAGGGDSIEFQSGSKLALAGSGTNFLVTSQVFRDPAAWYHIVYAVDTTQATAANRLNLYINGVQVTAFNTASYPAQNYSFSYFNTSGQAQLIGQGYSYYDGYVAEFNFIDGQQLTPSSFGSTNALTGVWQPAKYTGTYGTNGFYLPFTNTASTSTLGNDFSGNSNTWTVNNISLTTGSTYDSMNDVPMLTSATQANYATLNPVYKNNSQPTFSNGNLTIASNAGAYQTAFSTIGLTSGKWYCELTFSGNPTSAIYFGISNATQVNYLTGASNIIGATTGVGYCYVILNGDKYTNGNETAYGNAIASGDILGIALDLDNGKIFFSKNGTWQASGDPAAGTNAAFTGIASDTWFIGGNVYTHPTLGATTMIANFGQQGFTYTPPTGFKALNTYNLTDSAIVKGNKYMDATAYSGDSSYPRTITNQAQFKPDLVWVKARSTTYDHTVYDSVRGTGTSKMLGTNVTSAEGYDSAYANLTAFTSNGFTVDTTSATNILNNSGQTFVAWQWQAGQGSTSSNTSGSITSTVSVNATAGFSVVTYTGTGSNATVGHGLGVAPKMIIVKNRVDGTPNWYCYHASLPSASYALYLSLYYAQDVATAFWNNTAPTSSVFSVGTSSGVNGSTNGMVAYCWSEIAGFSKFGSYTGNGSTDGTFVYTGFRPRFILAKASSSVADWVIMDTARDTYNGMQNQLFPNLSNAESTGTVRFDALSNGFKLRVATDPNNSGVTYIYMAFAENPFKNALAR